ncbi:MAG: hypothetical protein LBQ79_13365 [Deltaproteobacteria bacterium]|nr:hypothetical protein [Deltaproteobacteria bacterium]
MTIWRILWDGCDVALECSGIEVADADFGGAAAVLPGGDAVVAHAAGDVTLVSRIMPAGTAAWTRDMGPGDVAALSPAAGGGIYGGGRTPRGRPRIFGM